MFENDHATGQAYRARDTKLNRVGDKYLTVDRGLFFKASYLHRF